jgi:hypothetical protein
MTDTPNLDQIVSDLRRWYYSEIRSLADAAIEEIKRGNDGEDWLHDWLHQTLDGHAFVIYTFKAKCALVASDNEGAIDDQFGHSGGTPEERCYYAMIADVRELLDARRDEWVPAEEEDSHE